ncbi:MAG: helix-turn-helix domain-containing protein [Firmicutes bacterium]|jgi:DNA-binding transcriptional MerR regulator|nr:helix-turn-helix domain-containing protein [Bacillota bacterium]
MENLLLTKKEAADCLRISVATLDCIRKRGLVTPIKIGARVYYTPAELRRLLEKKEIPTLLRYDEVVPYRL